MASHFIVQALGHKVMRSIPGLPEQYENNEGMDPLPTLPRKSVPN